MPQRRKNLKKRGGNEEKPLEKSPQEQTIEIPQSPFRGAYTIEYTDAKTGEKVRKEVGDIPGTRLFQPRKHQANTPQKVKPWKTIRQRRR